MFGLYADTTDVAYYLSRSKEYLENKKTDSAWKQAYTGIQILTKKQINYSDTLHTNMILFYIGLSNKLGYFKKTTELAQVVKPEKFILQANKQILLYRMFGMAYTETGDLETGLYYKQKALLMASDIFGEYHLELPSFYTQLGAHYRLMENFEQALIQYQKINNILLFNQKQLSAEQAYNYVNIGNVYGSIEEPEKAKNYYLKAIEIMEKSHPDKDIGNLAKTYSNLAKVENTLGLKTDAKTHAVKSLNLLRNNLGNTHPYYLKQLLNYAELFQEYTEYDSSLTLAYQSLSGFKKIYGNHHPDVAHSHKIIAEYYITHKNWDSALINIDLAQKACIINNKLQKTDIFLITLLQKSLVFQQKNEDAKKILICYTTYDSIVQYKKNTLYNTSDKIELIRETKSGYEEAIQFCYSKKLYENAFYFSEQSKSAVLLASILESNAKHIAGLPDSVAEKENYLKTQLAETEIKMFQANTHTQKSEYEKQYYICLNQLENYIKEIEKRFPAYYHLKYQPSEIILSDIQKKLSPTTMMISYTKTKKYIYLICITKKGIFMEEKPINQDFKGYITAFRRALKNKLPDYAWKPDATYLGKTLFPSQMPSSIKNIILIPEDLLLKIPFEPLVLPSNTSSSLFWIQKYSVSYSFSCKLWYEMEQKTYSLPYSVTAIAPVFNTKESTRMPNDMLVEGLPATVEETDYISQLFLRQGMPAQIFLAQDAQEFVIKKHLNQTRFIHFATHGYFDATNAGFSCIMLYPAVTDDDDGILYTKEIYNLSVNAELVVLSACETGLGKVFRGEGTMGLTRAWLYAGVKYVLASLWRVNDKATASLMKNFYFYLIEKRQTVETALYKAKLKLLQNPDYQNPYYWSSFVLVH